MSGLQGAKSITIISNRKHVTINADDILYITMRGRNAEVHVVGGATYLSRTALDDLEEQLGESFIRAFRSCLVSVRAVHSFKKKIELSNGELLDYPIRKKKKFIDELHEKQQKLISNFSSEGVPASAEEFRSHYITFECMPFAFADIEMVFDSEKYAVDWIFRYGNPALAKLEGIPLERLIGSSFGSLFRNMEQKWLRTYERATLYGETLEMIDHSPEVNAYLKVICFPTFPGHCGCILFNITDIEFTRNSPDAEKALLLYLGMLNDKI